METNIKMKAIIRNMSKKFNVIVEQDEDGMYIGKVLNLKGCLSQGKTLDELMKNIKEAISLCLEVKNSNESVNNKFIGVQQIEILS